MVALPAVLVARNCMKLLLAMMALPAVLVSLKIRLPTLPMVALPAVLVLWNPDAFVGDGGAAAVDDDAGAGELEGWPLVKL